MRKIDAIKIIKSVERGEISSTTHSNACDECIKAIKEVPDSGEDYVFDKKFTGLCPGWIDAPSELQPAHEFHGRKVIAMKEHDGYRIYLIGDEKARTIHLPECTQIVAGWDNK